MNWIPWVKADRVGLARYVTPATGKSLRLKAARSALLQQTGGRKCVCEAIYDALLDKQLRYSTEPYDADRRSQEIRSPAELLSGAGNGTCLDLAALYAGACLDNDLLPILVVLHGHAFVLVSLHYSRHQANDRARLDAAGGWTSKGILHGEHPADREIFEELLSSDAWLAVECTGLAFSTQLSDSVPEGQGRGAGYMSFDRACAAGRAHLLHLPLRPFAFAIDVAFMHDSGVAPYDYHAPWRVGSLWEVPSGTGDYVNRPALVNAIVDLLTADSDTGSARPHAPRPVALCGSPGIGKTTVAIAACSDERVQLAFPDGVIWFPVGQEPSVLRLLNEKINTVCGGVHAVETRGQMLATSIAEGTRQLAEQLATRRVLVVIDDVWQTSHLLPFLIGSPTCRILITSRDLDVVKAVKARVIEASVMTPGEARELLLSRWTDDGPEADRGLLDQLAAVLGYLPLGLELASQRIEDGYPLELLLGDLNREIARLDVIDRSNFAGETDEATARQLSLNASLNLSLARLPERLLEQFAWLGVLQSGSVIGARFAAKLWSTDETSAQCDLLALAAKSLLQKTNAAGEWTLRFSIHDVMLAKARNLLFGDRQQSRRDGIRCLEIMPAQAHATLIARYRLDCPGGQWHLMERDAYIEHHLFRHLRLGGLQQELFDLLGAEHQSQPADIPSNAWYRFRDQAGETDYFIDDVETALDLSLSALKAAIFLSDRLGYLGYAVQFCAMLVSVNNQGSNISPDAAISLVKAHIWTIESAHTHGKKHFSAAGLAKLAMHAAYPARGEILSTAIRNIQRSGALGARITQYLGMLGMLDPDEASIVHDRLSSLLKVGRPSVVRKVRALFAEDDPVPDASPPTEFDRFISDTSAMDDVHRYVTASVLVARSPTWHVDAVGKDVLDEIVDLVCRFDSSRPAGVQPNKELDAQYRKLYTQLLYAGLTIRKDLANAVSPLSAARLGTWIESRLAIHLPDPGSCPVFVFRAQQLLGRTLDEVELKELFGSLNGYAFAETQTAQRVEPLGTLLAEGLIDELAGRLAPRSLRPTLLVALRFRDPDTCRSGIGAIGKRFDRQEKMEVIDTVIAKQDLSGAWKLLRCWAQSLPQDFLSRTLASLLGAIDFRKTPAAELESLVGDVCALVEEICTCALDALLAVLRHIPSQAGKAMLLQSMLPFLPQEQANQLLPFAEGMSHFESKLLTYRAFLRVLRPEDGRRIVPDMIAAAMQLDTGPRSIKTLVDVADGMPPEVSVQLLSLALKSAMGVHDRELVSPVLAACIGGLSEPNRSRLLGQNPLYHGTGDYQGVDRLENSRFYVLDRRVGDIGLVRRDLLQHIAAPDPAARQAARAYAVSRVSREDEECAKRMDSADQELIDSLAAILGQDLERISRAELYEQICACVEEFNWRGLEVAGLTSSLGLRACAVWWP